MNTKTASLLNIEFRRFIVGFSVYVRVGMVITFSADLKVRGNGFGAAQVDVMGGKEGNVMTGGAGWVLTLWSPA